MLVIMRGRTFEVIKAGDLDLRKVLKEGDVIEYMDATDQIKKGTVNRVYRYFAAINGNKTVNWWNVTNVNHGNKSAMRAYALMVDELKKKEGKNE